jgi:DNA-binding CsgD family transcriptional regulator
MCIDRLREVKADWADDMSATYDIDNSGFQDSLTLDDYRALLGVVEDVTDAQSLADLGDRLEKALARRFGWADAFDVATLTVHVAEGSVPSPRQRAIATWLHMLLTPWLKALSHTETHPRHWCLTRRERDIAQLVAYGLTNRQIAAQLDITTDTVKKHLTSALTKADCTNRTQLALLWRHGQDRELDPPTELHLASSGV